MRAAMPRERPPRQTTPPRQPRRRSSRRKCPACDVLTTPRGKTPRMWRTALEQHLNGPAHRKATSPDLQRMVENEGLYRCVHCSTLLGF